MTRNILNLNAADRALLLEAVVLLVLVRVGVRLASFPALRRRVEARAPGAPRSVSEIAWAVTAAARRMRGTTCLVEALTAYGMLRRHGHNPAFKLGVREGSRREAVIAAHAWVECDGVIVAGTVDTIADYAVLS